MPSPSLMMRRAQPAGGISYFLITKPDARRCRMIYTQKCPPYAALLLTMAWHAGIRQAMKPTILPPRWQ